MTHLLLLALLSGTSLAAEGDDRAREYFMNGKSLFEEGEYQAAVDAWQKAYELSPRALLLYNIATAHEKLGELEEAKKFYMEYRIEAGSGELSEDQKKQLKDKIAALDVLIAEQQAADEVKAAEEAEAAAAEAAEAEAAAAEAAAAEEARLAEERKAAEKAAGPSPVLLASWGSTILFAGGAAAASLMARNALQTRDGTCDLASAGDPPVYICHGEKSAGIDRKHAGLALAADVGWGLAGAALGTSLYLQLSGGDDAQASAAGLQLRGTF